MATHSSILAWEIPRTGEPGWAIVHGVAKSQTRVSDFCCIISSQVQDSKTLSAPKKNVDPGTSLVAQLVKSLPAMWETWVQSPGQEDPLEKEMATHSSILAWDIPWTEESSGL